MKKYNHGVAESNRRRTKHGAAKNNTVSKVYHAWRQMRSRCNNPNHKHYASYGGRGIKVCSEWDAYENFLACVGEPPTSAHTLDRIDVNGNYEPGNVRWATRKTQGNNRRTNVYVEYEGERLTLHQWADKLGFVYGTLVTRHGKGVRPPELFEPAQVWGEEATWNGETRSFVKWAEVSGVPYSTLKRRAEKWSPLFKPGEYPRET